MTLDEMTYQKNLIQVSRAELLDRAQARLSKKRFRHLLGVEEAAVHLADRYGEDKERASIAALLHDYAKEASLDELQAFADHPGYDPDWPEAGNAIWHGPLAVLMAKRDLGLDDRLIEQAVWNHTLGSLAWTDLDKILYIADYIEANRDFPGVKEARKVAEKSLDAAVDYKIRHSLMHLLETRKPIHPQTIAVYNQWVQAHEEDAF
ncbi:bis(5'-nucleosyl)-tetraphosphatase (symmetrical) YqeK [Aerococcus sanguinicola]|uniref:bis(5'-nucleosyl)-tetraphosphatase (symmetrical) YqeK n=2 Tax=unclassified Aerococcus TaxID=2618060 RepID=UPI001FEF8604|nr:MULTISPECIES: bis(5'-nucleosyl)-tetraphosphatase (symmetrical) YqeK [unclassified Aerococcus]MDK6233022.1 bis(5'-nucleosyl)-tetraphosphatase (symmetrical) YqeK [Aerococcus sp. UMB10185]MDK6855316.1 bis(5'-nucleosyl)-tetraphosphatase (symmetrical) YqeK [Aerococcus sp. UMB7533]